MDRLYLAIEIGGTKLQLALGTSPVQIVRRWRCAVDRSKGAAGLREQIAAALREMPPGTSLAGVGVGFGGPVDWRTGRICRSHQIEGWSEFELAEWLQRLTNAPVHVDNDANVAALGEARHGAGAGCNPVFYVTLGSGVGGGLVVDGRIYHGAQPGEAEIGHVRLDRQETTVESRCSGWAVDQRVREFISTEPSSLLAQLAGHTHYGQAKFLGAALTQKDVAAERILSETAEDLAFGLSHVVHLCHPQVIVLGGGLSLLGEPLRVAVAQALPRFVMKAFQPAPEIRLTALHEDAVPVGALELAADA